MTLCRNWKRIWPDLARLAARLGRRPVYGFVRTDMRVGWFRARMPGVHIFIRREPRRQFLSMLRQAVQGNPYFLQRGVVILRHNMEAPAFAPLLSAMRFPAVDLPPLLDSSGLREAFRGKLVDETVLRRLYFIFYFMWLLARQLGEPHCHLVIDIDRLSLLSGAKWCFLKTLIRVKRLCVSSARSSFIVSLHHSLVSRTQTGCGASQPPRLMRLSAMMPSPTQRLMPSLPR